MTTNEVSTVFWNVLGIFLFAVLYGYFPVWVWITGGLVLVGIAGGGGRYWGRMGP